MKKEFYDHRISELKLLKAQVISANEFNSKKMSDSTNDYGIFKWLEGKVSLGENIINLLDKRIIELYEGSAKLAKPDQITETDEK